MPSKARQKLYAQIPIANQKSLLKIFNMMGSDIGMLVIHFEYKKNHLGKQKGVQSYSFCRAFHGASFEKKFKILSFT